LEMLFSSAARVFDSLVLTLRPFFIHFWVNSASVLALVDRGSPTFDDIPSRPRWMSASSFQQDPPPPHSLCPACIVPFPSSAPFLVAKASARTKRLSSVISAGQGDEFLKRGPVCHLGIAYQGLGSFLMFHAHMLTFSPMPLPGAVSFTGQVQTSIAQLPFPQVRRNWSRPSLRHMRPANCEKLSCQSLAAPVVLIVVHFSLPSRRAPSYFHSRVNEPGPKSAPSFLLNSPFSGQR